VLISLKLGHFLRGGNGLCQFAIAGKGAKMSDKAKPLLRRNIAPEETMPIIPPLAPLFISAK
jgi:hypothetical protein